MEKLDMPKMLYEYSGSQTDISDMDLGKTVSVRIELENGVKIYARECHMTSQVTTKYSQIKKVVGGDIAYEQVQEQETHIHLSMNGIPECEIDRDQDT